MRLGWVRTQAPFVVVCLLMLGGVAVLALVPGHWRPAAALFAAGLLAAALFRMVLPSGRAGMLVVRKARWWDTVCYLVMGGVVLALDIRLR
jgi:hypothetical protein